MSIKLTLPDVDAPKKPIFSDLKTRATVGIILAVVLLLPVFAGGYWFLGLALLVGLRLVWEWVRMSDIKAGVLAYGIPLVAMAGSVWFGWHQDWGYAWGFAIGGAIAAGAERVVRGGMAWSVFGFLYMVIPTLAMVYIRGPEPWFEGSGISKMVYVIAIVAFADIFAYLTGSKFRGPKIAPKLSPNKTWSGFFGGLFGGCVAGAVAAAIIGFSPILGFFLAIPIAVFSVVGDFLESGLKRRLNVKDTGGILPGHGGFLDRLDALMFAMTVFAIVAILVPDLWPMK